MSQAVAVEDPVLARTVALLGGEKAFKAPVKSRIEAHDLLRQGLPVTAVSALLKNMPALSGSSDGLERAIGMSLRTWQRRRDAVTKPLSAEQSNRAWKFAELLARASEIFGSIDAAIDWMLHPVMALDQRRPIDLVATTAGTELVENHLTRLDYAVYT